MTDGAPLDRDGGDRLPPPPPGRGISVDDGARGLRVTLPRLYTRADMIAAALLAAVAVWIGAWLETTSGAGATGSTLGRGFMALVGLFFAALALAEAVPILTRRYVEDGGDRLVLGRSLGARRFPRHKLPKSGIRLVDRVRDAESPGAGPEEVRVWAGDDEHRLGKHLDDEAVEWLETAVRQLAGR